MIDEKSGVKMLTDQERAFELGSMCAAMLHILIAKGLTTNEEAERLQHMYKARAEQMAAEAQAKYDAAHPDEAMLRRLFEGL
jgi:hypothetical protein